MLNNHLTFIQSVYKCSILLLIVSCSNIKVINSEGSQPQAVYEENECGFAARDVEERHLIVAAKIKSSVMANCFKNWLRFEDNKKQKISTCNQLSIRRNGSVSYVQVTEANGKQLPKDFKMCVRQEYWKMSFSGLQLDNSHVIRFPLNYSSI